MNSGTITSFVCQKIKTLQFPNGNIIIISPVVYSMADISKGTVVEVIITQIINPSQIITEFDDDFIGRLSVLDLSWCFPEGEAVFKKFQVGDRIQCLVLDIDFQNKQVILSQKHLTKPISETIRWERVERGDEFNVDKIVVQSLNFNTVINAQNSEASFNWIENKVFIKSEMINSDTNNFDIFKCSWN